MRSSWIQNRTSQSWSRVYSGSSRHHKSVLPPRDVNMILTRVIQDYQTALASAKKEQDDDKHDEPLHKRRKTEDPLEPKVQGALLLQAMLQLPSPYNDTIING